MAASEVTGSGALQAGSSAAELADFAGWLQRVGLRLAEGWAEGQAEVRSSHSAKQSPVLLTGSKRSLVTTTRAPQSRQANFIGGHAQINRCCTA